jgi:hypothetical protein
MSNSLKEVSPRNGLPRLKDLNHVWTQNTQWLESYSPVKALVRGGESQMTFESKQHRKAEIITIYVDNFN